MAMDKKQLATGLLLGGTAVVVITHLMLLQQQGGQSEMDKSRHAQLNLAAGVAIVAAYLLAKKHAVQL